MNTADTRSFIELLFQIVQVKKVFSVKISHVFMQISAMIIISFGAIAEVRHDTAKEKKYAHIYLRWILWLHYL